MRVKGVKPVIKKLLGWKWWWAVGVVLVIALVYTYCGSRRLGDKYNRMKGGYEARVEVAETALETSLVRIAALNDIISAKDIIIVEKDAAIAEKLGQLSAGNKELKDLESEYQVLGSDKDAKITNLLAQVATIKESLTVAFSLIADKDAQLAAWEVKFTSSQKISAEWKKAYEDEHALRLVCENLNLALEKKVKSTLFWSRAKNIAVVALAGYAAYNLIKK